MSSLFGALNLNDTDRVFQATAGQQVIYDAITEYVNRVNAEIQAVTSIFIDGLTQDYKLRYKLPGGGYLQRRGQQAQPGAVKTYGGWDVAFPLEDFGAQLAADDVSMAYMTVGDLDRHISTVVTQNANTIRFELLKALFNNAQDTFVDPLWGSLSIEPLANGDSVTYPPVIGSSSEATDDHYLESGYLASAVSDTNNPYVTIEAELVEHFGKSQGNDNVAVFINSAQMAVTEALTDFIEVQDRFVVPGTNTATLSGLPGGHPGRVIGRVSGCWVIEWDHIPSGYMLGIQLDTAAPLKQRIDPADTGLGTGLQIVARDANYPFETSFWRHRFGFGAANRLNGVVMELANGGGYTVPTAYA